ncbi:Uncharacterised protein [Actinobacillus equuli]|nr:Uncharacterised protein [Actinobacillus equuli]
MDKETECQPTDFQGNEIGVIYLLANLCQQCGFEITISPNAVAISANVSSVAGADPTNAAMALATIVWLRVVGFSCLRLPLEQLVCL